MFTAIDFEGTSLEGSARATEVAVVSLTESLHIGDSFESVLNPPIQPKKESLSYARLSKDQIACAPSFHEIFPSLIPFLSEKILIAHNKIYEIGVLSREFADMSIHVDPPFICTLEWSRQILKHKLSNYTLLDVCGYYDIDLLNPHEALADATATAQVFAKLYVDSSILRDFCGKLASDVVKISSKDLPKNPQIRDRFTAVSLGRDDLLVIASEILNNSKVMQSKFVVVTGKILAGKPRLDELIEQAGLKFKETPTTEGTAFVIQGHAGGLTKIKKAHLYGRPVLTVPDAFELLEIITEMRMER